VWIGPSSSEEEVTADADGGLGKIPTTASDLAESIVRRGGTAIGQTVKNGVSLTETAMESTQVRKGHASPGNAMLLLHGRGVP